MSSLVLAPGSRMVSLVHLEQSLLRHLRIDLRGGNGGMAKHFLHYPQIGPMFQHMSGATMS